MRPFQISLHPFGLILSSLTLIVTLTACGEDPQKVFHEEIEKLGYIPYTTPLKHSGTGTLIGGTPSLLQIVAPPERCFPKKSLFQEELTRLRFTDETTLASKRYQVSVSGNARLDLMKFLNIANSVGQIGAHFQDVKSIHLDMKGVKIEYFDSILLAKHYRTSLPEICKDFLDHVAFITQTIQVSTMTFQFEDEYGYLIDLDSNLPTNYINLGLGIEYRVRNRFQLEILTPKYVGYQVGKLTRNDRGLALHRASRVEKNRFIFEPLTLFKTPISVRDFLLGTRSKSTQTQVRVDLETLIEHGLLPKNYQRPW